MACLMLKNKWKTIPKNSIKCGESIEQILLILLIFLIQAMLHEQLEAAIRFDANYFGRLFLRLRFLAEPLAALVTVDRLHRFLEGRWLLLQDGRLLNRFRQTSRDRNLRVLSRHQNLTTRCWLWFKLSACKKS